MKRRGLFRSVIALLVAAAMVFTELPVMPQSLTSVFAGVEDGENTVLETTDGLPAADEGTVAEDLEAVSPVKALLASAPSGGDADLATKYAQYVSSDYPYIDNYKSGFEEIVLTSYESQRGDMILEWPGTEDAAYYDIFRNKTWITSIAADAQMSYDDGAVEGSQTYNYVVFARNNSDEIIGTSKAISCRTKEALVISSYTNLDSDMSVFSVDITGGNLSLNGHTLTVCRDITVTNGYNLNMNAGKVKCYGNVCVGTEEKSAYLEMDGSNSSLYIAGNLECLFGYCTFDNGTVEIVGDINVEKGHVRCTLPNKIVFSGFESQNVTLTYDSCFAEIELRNYSLEGVNFTELYRYLDIKTNNLALKIAGEPAVLGITLTADKVIDGDYEFNAGTLDLNGHTLTVTGDLIQAGGILDVNGGTLNVGGDYRAQSRMGEEGSYTYGRSTGALVMMDENDRVNIAGNFYCQSSNMASETLTDGEMCVGGNFTVYYPDYSYNFSAEGDHTVVFNGTGNQIIASDYKFSYGSNIRFANVRIENSTDGNVIFGAEGYSINVDGHFNDNGHAFGGYIVPSQNTTFENKVINGSVFVDNSIDLYESLEIKGDVILKSSLDVYRGKLTVDGNMYLGRQYTYYSFDENGMIHENESYSSGYLYVYGESYSSGYSGSLYVKGSIIADEKSYPSFYNYSGTMAIGGDLTLNSNNLSYSSYSYKDARFIFCGTGKQTVSIPASLNLSNVVIENTSEEGVVFVNPLTCESYINASIVPSVAGWTLEADETYTGNLVLSGGKLDLNGHTLTVTGDLIQPVGTVSVNGGELNISGDYRIQSVNETEEGIVYGKSTGYLEMKNENDRVNIAGGFYCLSNTGMSGSLVAGVMDIKGDFIVDSSYNSYTFCAYDKHKVIFSGDTKQTVEFTTDAYDDLYSNGGSTNNMYGYIYSYLNDVEMKNADVFFGRETKAVPFHGKFTTNGHIVNGYLQPVYSSSFTEDKFDGSLYFTNSMSTSGSYNITGDVIITDGLSLYGSLVAEGNLIFDNRSDNTNNSPELYLSSSYDSESETQIPSYLEIHGDIQKTENTSDCRIYYDNGTIKLFGDMDILGCNVINYSETTKNNDTNYLILCGTEKQTVNVNSDSSFGRVVIENTSDEGVYSDVKINAYSIKNDNGKYSYGAENEDVTPDTPDDGEGDTWVLERDEVRSTEDLVITDGMTVNLNGHTLTVEKNLIQEGGVIKINHGTLIVEGDYLVQKRVISSGEYTYTYSSGKLVMIYDDDAVRVNGNFVFKSDTEPVLTKGEMYVAGDFTLGSYSFRPSGTHTVIFNGSGDQTVTATSSSNYFANVNIINPKENAVNFSKEKGYYPAVNGNMNDNGHSVGGCLRIMPGTTFTDKYHGSVTVTTSSAIVNDYEITGDFILSDEDSYTFTGNITIGGQLIVNSIFDSYYWRYDNVYVYINGVDSVLTVKNGIKQLENTSIYFRNAETNIDGNINCTNSYARMYFENGVCNCYGNISMTYTDSYIGCSTGHKFNFCGTNTQNIKLNEKTYFADIEINNVSDGGVVFNRLVPKDSLVTNGNKVKFGYITFNEGETLTDDKVIADTYRLVDGVLDLAGHTLTIKGDLYLTGGTINLNGGKLFVEGNFYATGQDGYGYSSGYGYGSLVMTNENDYFCVYGNINQIRDTYRKDYAHVLTAGTMEIKGDCTGDQITGTGNFRLVFSGSEKQTVSSITKVPYLINKNTAELKLSSSVTVTKEVTDNGGNITGSNLYVYDLSVINGYFSGSVYLNTESTYNEADGTYTYSDCTLTRDVTIGGALTQCSTLYLDNYKLTAGGMTVRDSLYVQKGSIICNGSLQVDSSRSGYIEMADDEAYIFVSDNFSTYKSSYSNTSLQVDFSAGTLELQGDFLDANTPFAFKSSGTNTVILSGKTVDGSDYIQSIKITDTKSKFNKLILKKNDSTYKFSRKLSSMAKEISREVDTSGIPGDVTGLKILSYAEASVKLTYNAATDDKGVIGYRICRNGAVCGATTELVFTDTGLKPDTEYVYTVFAYDAENNMSEYSDTATVRTKPDNINPDSVKEMSVTKRTGSSVTLTWKAAVDNVAIKDYEVYRKEIGGEYILLATHVKKTTYKDSSIAVGKIYRYCLIAVDTSGNKSVFGCETEASASRPQILSITPSNGDEFGGSSVKFEVRYLNWGRSENNYVTIEYEDRENNWIPVSSYKLSQNKDEKNLSQLYSTYNWYFTDADINENVRFRIILTDEDGNKDEKVITCVIDRIAPVNPEEFTAADNSGTVELSWSPSASDDCKGYRLYRRTESGQSYYSVATITGRTNLSYSDKNVTKGTTYYYAIETYDNFGNTSERTESEAVTVTVDTQAPVVRAITPENTVIGNGRVTIAVNAEDNKEVTSVIIQYRKENENGWKYLNEVPFAEGNALYNLDTSDFDDGEYIICAVAKDEAGNKSQEFTRRYTFDNTGISKLTLNVEGVYSSSVMLEWSEPEETDLNYISLEKLVLIENEPTYVQVISSYKTGEFIQNLLPGTEYTFAVVGYDMLGNRGVLSDPVTITTVEDTIGPSIISCNDINERYNKSVHLYVQAKDNLALDYAIFSASTDGVNYDMVAKVDAASTDLSKNTFEYNYNVSSLPEGDIYIKYEVYDVNGLKNQLTSEGKDVTSRVTIDRTAPDKVSGLNLRNNSGSIDFEWDIPDVKDAEDKVSGFIIKRAEDNSGVFNILEANYAGKNYIDNSVTVGKVYRYKVAAIDMAGNIGEYSEELSASAEVDETAPGLSDFSPATGSVLCANPVLAIGAADNRELDTLYIEYTDNTEAEVISWMPLYEADLSGVKDYKEINWNTNGLSEGDYALRAYVTDTNGNSSEYKYANYTLDLTAPEAPAINVTGGNLCIKIDCEGTEPEDFDRYELYRRVVGSGKEKELVCRLDEKSYLDYSVDVMSTYAYQIAACDLCGNKSWSEEKEGRAIDIDDIAPEAILSGSTVSCCEGDIITLFAGNSTDNVGITEYKWFIDDSFIGDGVKRTWNASSAGTYKLKLEVYDKAGNKGIAEDIIVISKKNTKGSLAVTVTDEYGTPLPMAYINIQTLAGETVENCQANDKGSISFALEPGSYKVAGYFNGYLPQDETVDIHVSEKRQVEIRLPHGEIVESNLQIRHLTPAEMQAEHVDLSNPANYNSAYISFEFVLLDSRYNFNGMISYGHPVVKQYDDGTSVSAGFPSPDCDLPIIVVSKAKQAVSWLSDMYEVNLTVLNKATYEYTIDNSTATLALPKGVMFAALTDRIQRETIDLGSIAGGEKKEASWIIKGTSSGKYVFTADFNGKVMPFESAYETKAYASANIVVSSGKGLHLFIKPHANQYVGSPYYIDYALVNENKNDFKNIMLSVCSDNEVFEPDEAENSNEINSSITVDGNKIMLSTLKPRDPLFAYVGTTTEVTDANKSSNIVYDLIAGYAEFISGKNLGVKVSVVDEFPDFFYKEGEVNEDYGHLKWKVEYGVLTVTGEGDYADPKLAASKVKAPWCDGECESHIKKAEIDIKDMTLTTAMFEGCKKIKSVSFKDSNTNKITNMSRMFKDCTGLVTFDMEQLYSATVKDISQMFMGCTALYEIECDGFLTGSVTNVTEMFKNCSALKELDISGWDFFSVNKLDDFLYGCKKLTKIESPRRTPAEDITLKDCCGGTSWKMAVGDELREVTAIVKDMRLSYTYTRDKAPSVYKSVFTYAASAYKEKLSNNDFKNGKDVNYDYEIDFKDFFKSSSAYQHSLIKASIRTAMAAFDRRQYSTGLPEQNILDLMENLGFENIEHGYSDPDYNSIGYIIGSRDIYSDDEEATLILIAIRGGGYGEEWGGNFNVGTGMEHSGFNTAAETVINGTDEYVGLTKFIENNRDRFKDKVKIWAVGYSRAGATANLVCAKAIDGKINGLNINPEDVFGFCFECPRTTTNGNAHADKYNGIKCVVNPTDFVPMVPMNNGSNWNFERYGITYSTGALDDKFDAKKTAMISQYENILCAQGISSFRDVVKDRLPEDTDAYVNQEIVCTNLFKRLADNTVDRKNYVNELQSSMVPLMGNFMSRNYEAGTLSSTDQFKQWITKLGLSGTKAAELIDDLGFFVNAGASGFIADFGTIMDAHLPELCLAWVDSVNQLEIYKQNTGSAYIYYHANGGSGAPSATNKVNADKTVTISKDEPTRSGYIFAGWTLKSDNSKMLYTTQSDYYPEEEIKPEDYGKTLYARWISDDDYYRLALHEYEKINGKTMFFFVKKGKKSDYLPQSLGIEEYQIKSWFTKTQTGTPIIHYQPGEKITPEGNMDLYPEWKHVDRKYVNITYDLNGGTCDNIKDSKIYDGEELVLPDAMPERDGYVFVGWVLSKKDADLGVAGRLPGEHFGLKFKDHTLYASWTEVSSEYVRNQLQKLYGADKFPNDLFWKAQSPQWIDIPEKNAFVCLKTEEVDYDFEDTNFGTEGKRKNYVTDAFVFGINEKDKIYVKDFAGFEMTFNPFDLLSDIAKNAIATNMSNFWANYFLIGLSAFDLTMDLIINYLTAGIQEEMKFATKGGQIAWSIITTAVGIFYDFAILELTTEKGKNDFCDKYVSSGFTKDTALALVYMHDDLVEIGKDKIIEKEVSEGLGKKFKDFVGDNGGDILEFLLDIIDIIIKDYKYSGFDPYGNKDFAIGTVVDRMSDHDFGDAICNEVCDKIVEIYNRSGKRSVTVNCPVDVKVYNAAGDLLGYIKDNVPQYVDSGLFTYVDGNGQKQILMNRDRQYSIELIATDDGEVTLKVETDDLSNGEPSQIQTFSDMKVKKGDVISVDIMPVVEYETPDEDGCKAVTPVKLVINDREEVKATTVQKGNGIETYHVTAESSNTGAGTVTGGGSFYNGEFCKVTATAKDGYEFKGWKENGKLVSSDAEYRFEINSDHNIVGEFMKKSSTDGGNTSGGNTGYPDGGNTSGGNISGGNTGDTGNSGITDSGNAAGETGEGGNTGNTDADNTGKETGNNEGNGGNDNSDDKEKETSQKFKVKVGAVYTDENGVRYTITAIEGKKKATENTVKYLGPDSSSVKKIVIPDTVTIEGKTFAVTALDTAWTKGNKKLETVVINDNIKKITADTFKGCTSLKKITLGANVTAIGKNAFYKCTALKTVKLSANLTKIGDAAFYACKSLKKITIPSKVKTIGEKAFYKCTSLKSVTMSSTVLTGIGSKAFFDCGGLEKITIPSKVDAIGTYAFYRCRKLGNVTIKTKLLNAENVGKKAFAGLVPDAVITVPKAKVKEYTDLLKKVGVTKKMTVKK